MNKKIILSLIILIFICGCSKNNNTGNENKNAYDENGKNEMVITTNDDITVTGTKIINDGGKRVLKLKMVSNITMDCDSITIKVKDKKGDIIKTLNIGINRTIYVGEVILVEEDYSFEEKEPYSFEIIYNPNNGNSTNDTNLDDNITALNNN